MIKAVSTLLVVFLLCAPASYAADGIATYLRGEDTQEVSSAFLKNPAQNQSDPSPALYNDLFPAGRIDSDPVVADLKRKMVPNAIVSTQVVDDPNATNAMDPAMKKKNPGRAVLLSALVPGAGELYAGAPLKAAGFFLLEVACWGSAIYFTKEGKDKEDAYELFADENWDETIYRDFEFFLAKSAAGEYIFEGERLSLIHI